MASNPKKGFADKKMIGRAISDSFIKLNPKTQAQNPVMLVVYISAILTTIPQCVLGGATITVFSTIAMTGMKLIASETISPRNTTIVGLSAALGVGISQSSSALSQFPESITIIFGKTPVVIATIMAVLLNLILPQENKDQ